jgi:hypothetical protein
MEERKNRRRKVKWGGWIAPFVEFDRVCNAAVGYGEKLEGQECECLALACFSPRHQLIFGAFFAEDLEVIEERFVPN